MRTERLPRPLLAGLRALLRLRPEMIVYRRGLADRMRVSGLVHEVCRGSVQRGPFAGMKLGLYLPDTSAKVLGSYEEELHDVVARLIVRSYRNVVNVGCSDGYYAVGCARRMAGATVYAYDLSPDMQNLTQATAVLNDVRVEVRGLCTPDDLEAIAASGATLIVSDCEGAELELIDPVRAPALVTATMLVELHELPGAPALESLAGRLEGSHRAKLIQSRPRDPGDYPELSDLTAHDRALAVFERPIVQWWALFEPIEAFSGTASAG